MSAAADEHDWYALLGVSPAADPQEIRQAYKREALRHHPDKNLERVEEATEMFKLVAEAYTVLSDPRSRAEYDARVRRASGAPSPASASGGRRSASFTAGRAADVFREVFGEPFVAGLMRAAREAAPHVRAAAQATRSAIANVLDQLTTPPQAGRPRVELGPSPADDALAPAVPPPSAPEHGAYSPTEVSHPVDCRQRLRCTLRWIAGESDVELTFAAYLVGCGGMYLGCVDNALRGHAANVAEQFRECGIEHLGSAPPLGHHPPQREEAIALDLDSLTKSEICSYVFLRVAAGGGIGRPSSLTLVDVEVASCTGEQSIFTVEVTGSSALWDERGVVAALFVRDEANWSATPVLLPCGEESIGGDALESTMTGLAQKADDFLRKYKAEQREAAEVAAAISAVEGALAAESPEKTAASSLSALSVDDEQLAESIRVYAENGNFTGAVEGQEALLRRLMEYDERDGGDVWQAHISRAFTRMDELWSRVSEMSTAGASSSGAGASSSRTVSSPPAASACPGRLAEDLARESQPSPGESQSGAAGAEAPVGPSACSSSGRSPPQTETRGGSASSAGCPPGLLHGPISPSSGSKRGGLHIRWVRDGPAPVSMTVDGRPCAPLEGGVFVLPSFYRQSGSEVRDVEHVDVKVEMLDGGACTYAGCFAYWSPGLIRSIEPLAAPVTGGREMRVATSDLGAPITEVLVGGVACQLVGDPSAREVAVLIPPSERDGVVGVEVRAGNGNAASSEDCFSYTIPTAFGMVGEHVELFDEGRRATRVEGVSGGVCLGAFPLRRSPDGCFFEVLVEETCKSIRAMAVGVRAGRLREDEAPRGHVHATEARELERVWLAGYDKAGALFLSDGEETKIPTAEWRPIKDVKGGTRVGVLWAEPQGQLVVYQDGVERVRLQATGRLPQSEEELFAVVDVHGTARSVSFVEGSTAPAPEPDPAQ